MPTLSPQTVTSDEQRALLAITAEHARGHAIFSLALGTGLRLGELVGLNVGDVYFPTGELRGRIHVHQEIGTGGRTGDVFLIQALTPKLRRLWAYKLEHGEPVTPEAPLFCALSRRRISTRRVEVYFRAWQEQARFDRVYSCHKLRHSSVTTCTERRGTCSLPRDSPGMRRR